LPKKTEAALKKKDSQIRFELSASGNYRSSKQSLALLNAFIVVITCR
jgi:hypothetical protein